MSAVSHTPGPPRLTAEGTLALVRLRASLKAIWRHPRTVARFAFHLDRDDGASIGWMMRDELSSASRRRLGAAVLSRDDIAFRFEADGFRWTAPAGDEITRELLVVGEYSATEVASLTAWLHANRPRTGRTVIEVGANIGTTSLPLARHGFRIIAIEPISQTFGYLAENVAGNDFDDVISCVRLAITDADGLATMALGTSHGRSHVVDASRAKGPIDTVPAMRLDTLLKDRALDPADVAFVWCDAEGGEAGVIATGEPLWIAGVPLYAECARNDDASFSSLIKEAQLHFAAFIPDRELTDTAKPRPIDGLKTFLAAQQLGLNVLLLPSHPAADPTPAT